MNSKSAQVGRRGFTLIELIATMVVLAIAAASVTPLLIGLTDSARAARHRLAMLDALHRALDRSARLLREASPGVEGGVDLSEATAAGFALADGRGVRFLDGTLWLDPGDGSTWPLARGIDSFSVRYLTSDGVTEADDPAAMQRVAIMVQDDGVPLTTIVYFRAGAGDVP